MPDEHTVPVASGLMSLKLRTHRIRIDVVDGPDSGRSVELEGPGARIGSGKECDISLKDPTVSRIHLLVRVEGDQIRITDPAVARALSLGSHGQGRNSAAPPDLTSASGVNLGEPLLTGRERVAEAYERAYVEAALKQTGGNISRAAELAKVNRKFIQRAMKRFGLRGDGSEEME